MSGTNTGNFGQGNFGQDNGSFGNSSFGNRSFGGGSNKPSFTPEELHASASRMFTQTDADRLVRDWRNSQDN